MAREIALSFALGARLQSGFTAAFQSASSQAKAVSQAIRDMERTPVGKIGAAMSTQQEKILAASRMPAASLMVCGNELHRPGP